MWRPTWPADQPAHLASARWPSPPLPPRLLYAGENGSQSGVKSSGSAAASGAFCWHWTINAVTSSRCRCNEDLGCFSAASNSSSWPMKLKFGATMGRRDLTKRKASSIARFDLAIMYAIANVDDRDTPAWQWIRTWPPPASTLSAHPTHTHTHSWC